MNRLQLLFALLFLPFLSFAQTPGDVQGYTLWLMGSNDNDTPEIQKISNPEEKEYTHFNFNPTIDLSQEFKREFKNIVSEQYSLFVVFKSDFEDERNVISINRGRGTVYITNKALLNDLEMAYKKINPRNGIILSYITNNTDKKGKRKNKLELDEFFAEENDGKEQLMELIYYPRILSSIERQKVETYLSVKYGTSIAGEYDYIDSAGKKIWEFKNNTTYNNRVTGIGRDDLSGLYQKQSRNADRDGICIGLGTIDTTNTHNQYDISDKTFLVWGDNGAATRFITSKNSKNLKIIERVWKMQTHFENHPDSITTQLRINKKEFGYIKAADDKDLLWLVINDGESPKFDYVSARQHKQASEDEEYVYFNNVVWDRNGDKSDTFTFIKGPDFHFDYPTLASCDDSEEGKIKINIMGGTPPYNISIKSNSTDQDITTANNSHDFTNLANEDFTIKVTDSRGNQQQTSLTLDPFSLLTISLQSVWHLNAFGEALIYPVIQGDDTGYTFEWRHDNRVLFFGEEYVAVKEGSYSLTVTSPQGCSKELPFAVEENTADTASGWTIFPNPSKHAELFSVLFDLAEESDVSIRINSMEGKSIVYKELGFIKDYEYRGSIVTSGVYLVTVTINNTPQTARLIIL